MKFVPRLFVRFTEEELLSEIRRVIAANGDNVPRPSLFEKLSKVKLSTVKARFGGYKEAISCAGYVYAQRTGKRERIYTRKATEADLKRVLDISNGYRFSHSDYKKSGGLYADKTIKSLMNASNWNEVMRAIGTQVRPRVVRKTSHSLRRRELADLTSDSLLDEIGRVWGLENRRPKYTDFNKNSNLGVSIFEGRFGSWSKAIEAYCKRESVALQGRPGTYATDEILLAELRSIRRKRPNDQLTYDFYRLSGGTYSIGAFQAHFGSWTAAVRKVDAASGKNRKYTTDQLFDELQRLWEELGRQPTFREMWKKGTISSNSYTRAFGGWNKAVVAFCDDRNAETELTGPDEVAGPEAPSLTGMEAAPPSQGVSVGATPKARGIPSTPLVEAGVKLILKVTPRMPSKRLRFRVLMRDGFQCRICGRSKEKDGVVLEVDHIDAYARDGETTIENLWTLCRDCNQGKSDLSISLDLFQSQVSGRNGCSPIVGTGKVSDTPPDPPTH